MRIITTLIVAAAALPVAASNIYKWTDASGQVHFSQTPPPQGASSVKSQTQLQPGVTTQSVPVAPPPAAAATKPGEEKTAAAPESKEAKSKRCAASKERLALLEERTAYRLMITQPDGSESRMTEEQFAESVSKAREAGKGC